METQSFFGSQRAFEFPSIVRHVLYQCVFNATVHYYLRFARQLAGRYFKSEITRNHLEKVESELLIVGRKMTQPVGVLLGKKEEASL